MRTSARLPMVGLLHLVLAASVAFAQDRVDGHWKGTIDAPDQSIEIQVDFNTAEGALTGEISIPAQDARDVALAEVVLSGTSIQFKMPGIPGDPAFEGNLSHEGDRISGTFRQGGAEMTFQLVRGDDPAAAARAALEGFGEVIEKAMKDFNVPGVALAVVAGGEVVFAEGFGYRDLENELPMTKESLFAIGSTTKAMTATLLGMLVDEGKLDWDEPLRTYLPEFRLSDPMTTERITPRDLVTHRSGLPRHDLLWYNNNDPTRAEMVARMAHLELTEDLRAKFQYNNLMFMTAGYLAGQLSGTTWEAAMRDRLFAPLGMERSGFSVQDSQKDPDHALPYKENDDDELERIPFRDISLVGPAGSVNSSVNEMSRWLLLNLRGGKIGDEQLINPSTLSEIQSPQMTTGATQDRPDISAGTYGMGWGVDTYRGHRRISHGGGIDGFSTSVMFFPDDDLGLVSFNNIGSGLPFLIIQHAADRVLGLEEEDWLGEALEERIKGKEAGEKAEEKKGMTRVEGTGPSHPLEDYPGEYDNPGYGTLTIARDGENLKLLYNDIDAPLEHWHYDVWSGAETDDDPTFEDQKFLFRGNEDGLIAEVESRLEPRAEPIVFRKKPDSRLFDAEYLRRFVGKYEDETGTEFNVELSGNNLILSVPGEPPYTLEPELSGRFVLQEFRVASLDFQVDEKGRVNKIMLHLPGGIFELPRVED
ncbi:MAG: serine hydrolase [Planctomycetota bacterium]